MEKNLVVIGAGSAGASACFAARKQDRKVKIVCINQEPFPSYSRCALPFVIGGEIDSFDTPTVFDFDFYKKQNVDIMPGVTVETVDVQNKVVKTSAGDVNYTELVLATGGNAKSSDLPGTNLEGVFVLRTRDDAERILGRAEAGKNALVNGASFIALEVAEALKHRGMKVTCVIRSRALRSMVDKEISQFIEEKLVEKGVIVLKGAEMSAILGEGKVTGVTVGENEVSADMVVMCTGVVPDNNLAKSMGLEIGSTGGIKVSERMETSVSGIYAAGDCVENECFVTKKPVLSGLGTIATRQGMVAGANAVGADMKAPPVLGASVMKLFDIEIGAVGPTEDFARGAGIDVAALGVKYPSLPHYYPGGTDVQVRLLADKATSKIIGGQIIVHRGAAERINMLSMAILKGATAQELNTADFCYSPPCSDIWAAEAVAAQGLVRRLESKKSGTP
jgi:NADH oxidase (H2O2-forming)